MVENVSGPHPGPAGEPGGLGISNFQLINIDILIGIGNICLLLALIYIYGNSFKKVKSKFTVGLLLFAILLLLQNVLFIGFLFIYQGFRGPGMDVPVFFLNVTQFIALSVLLWITLE
jgi:hypothetical protein